MEHRNVGERGLLLVFESTGEAIAAFRELDSRRHELDLAEVVPGHTTLLLEGHRWRPAPNSLRGDPACAGTASSREISVPVTYGGPDLPSVAAAAGVSVEEVVRRHWQPTYTVAFLGFAPGQPYLVGGDPSIAVARRRDPRTRVPAGSVATAGEYSTIYPCATPGGWQLIGATEMVMFDVTAATPARLCAGDRVRFVEP